MARERERERERERGGERKRERGREEAGRGGGAEKDIISMLFVASFGFFFNLMISLDKLRQ